MTEITHLNDHPNPLLILDKVLETLKQRTEKSPLNELQLFLEAKLELTDRDRHIIIDKLETDKCIGKIKRLLNPDDLMGYKEDAWHITFNGIMFIRSGGYTQQEINVLKNENRRVRNERLLVRWTAGVVIATIFLGLVEILKECVFLPCP